MKTLLQSLILFFISILICFSTAAAQDSVSIPDTLSGWNTTWEVGLNGSQASYSNWSQGGINNIAATGNTTFMSLHKKDRFSYGLLINLRYGKTRIQNEGIRKIDDRLFIINRFLYDLAEDDGDFKIFANVRFRTQFDKGFNYNAEPNELISNFMAPAYFTQEAGLAYIPNEMFSFEAGLGLQQTIVRDETLSEIYGLDEGKRFENKAGLTIGSSFNAEIAENIKFSSSIGTFTSFGQAIKSTDVYFSNKFTARVNRLMNTSLSLDLVYNDDYSNEIQVAQVLSLGIAFDLR